MYIVCTSKKTDSSKQFVSLSAAALSSSASTCAATTADSISENIDIDFDEECDFSNKYELFQDDAFECDSDFN